MAKRKTQTEGYMSVIAPPRCDKCDGTDDAVLVRERVPGTATRYQSKAILLCKECRAKRRGMFMRVPE